MAFSLSTKGCYAVLLMYQLAQSDGALTSLSEISSAQNISQGYLEKIVRPLKEQNLVQSKRGYGGGYRLAKPPDQITIGEIVTISEGPVAPVQCVNNDFSFCVSPLDCKARLVWRKVGDAISSVLNSITLQDLLELDDSYNLKGENDHG